MGVKTYRSIISCKCMVHRITNIHSLLQVWFTVKAMEMSEQGRKSGKAIPVIVEKHECGTQKIKLMVPSHYTASHLANLLRKRMQLHPHHSCHLFLKAKHRPLMMSKRIGHLHNQYRDERGYLHLVQAEQSTFGFRGNIRAIRFRQKWLENHPPSSGTQTFNPPYYFPQEAPTFGMMSEYEWMQDSYENIVAGFEVMIGDLTLPTSASLVWNMPTQPPLDLDESEMTDDLDTMYSFADIYG